MENLYLDTRDLFSQQWCMAMCSHLSATQICFLQFHSFYNNLANRCDVKASRELCPADLACIIFAKCKCASSRPIDYLPRRKVKTADFVSIIY